MREPGRGRAKSADGGRPGGGRRHGHDGPLGAGERACDGICSDCFVITVYVQEEFLGGEELGGAAGVDQAPKRRTRQGWGLPELQFRTK